MWALAATDFGNRAEDLLWWDFTAGDRWQVAGGDQDSVSVQLRPLLAANFSRVVFGDQFDLEIAEVTRLLVTSHRPLSDLGRRDERLARAGVCLVMGHPSLAADLIGYLGAGWRVGATFDLSPADLFPER